jgi:general secretion pathway protein E
MESAYLELTENKTRRKVPLDGGPLTVGRNFTNLLVIEEPMASRFHCVIESAAEGFIVRDLDSRNGTKVNGKLIKAYRVGNGDVISIGKTEMKLVVPSDKKQAAGRPKVAEHQEPLEEFAELVTDDALVEEEDAPVALDPVAAADAAPGDYEKTLRDRAESLVDRSFTDWEIALVNARGKVAHPPTTAKNRAPAGDTVTLLRLILLVCFRSRATDIHVEPKQDDVLVRVRVDGTMVDVVRLTKDLGIKLSSVVKILSDIDISQKNIVQEGHFSARVPTRAAGSQSPERRVDYRVSFAPAMFGQKLVVRVLDTSNAPLHIDDLQLPPRALSIIKKTSEQESGMILVCGPTGSGKTTTLYAILRDIDTTESNVVTIEDPVEIQLEGVTQIPVNDAQGNTFSAMLRSVLRQDPDVILIGEIRDAETARVGVQAGMTGHLVFSTVHSRDTVGGVFRLLDLGVEPYVVGSGLHLVLAQRLVRQLCAHCKVGKAPTAEQAKKMAEYGITNVAKVFTAKGCKRCLGTGHLGRRGVFELLSTTPAMREVILKNPTVMDIQKALDPEHYIRLQESGYQLVAEGAASFEEIEKVIA